MNISRRSFTAAAASLAAAGVLAACGSKSGSSSSAAATGSTGPITIWMSNNEQEVAWGRAVVEAWNTAHPDQKVTAQEIPAGKSSEETITAAITAGTTPDLIFNISTAAAPGWAATGGLVDLTTFSDGKSYIESRSGADLAKGYADAEGRYYLLPWKSNPVLVMYNKDIFKKAGIDPENPGMSSFSDFLAGCKKIVDSGAAKTAIWPAPTSEFYQPWFDYYPVYIAQADGTQLVVDQKATFNSDDGKKVASFWAEIYANGYASKEAATDDAMVTGATAMQMAGPWAIASYKDKVNVGFMPIPTESGSSMDSVKSFADSKNVSMFATSINRQTAWEFLKFATSVEQDGKFLEATGQMPIRSDLATSYSDYFKSNPEYEQFAGLASRTVDVPNIANSTEVWQTFRNEYSAAVIFATESVDDFLSNAETKINSLVKG
nr:sugar ABC transporter substrate-binding protein [Actinomyces sp.]